MKRLTCLCCALGLSLAGRSQVASLTIGRLHYDGGGDWYSGPSKLVNLLGAIRQRTRLAVGDRERVVTLTSPGLWDVPYLYMTGHGNVRFAAEEVPILRRYLEQGGFLHADDDYGMESRSGARSRVCFRTVPSLKSR